MDETRPWQDYCPACGVMGGWWVVGGLCRNCGTSRVFDSYIPMRCPSCGASYGGEVGEPCPACGAVGDFTDLVDEEALEE